MAFGFFEAASEALSLALFSLLPHNKASVLALRATEYADVSRSSFVILRDLSLRRGAAIGNT